MSASTSNRHAPEFTNSDFDEQVLTQITPVDRSAIGALFQEDNAEIDRVNDPENDGDYVCSQQTEASSQSSAQSYYGLSHQVSTPVVDDPDPVTEPTGSHIGNTGYEKALDIAKEISHTEEEKNVVARFISRAYGVKEVDVHEDLMKV